MLGGKQIPAFQGLVNDREHVVVRRRPVLFEVSQVLCSLLRPSGPASAPRLPEPTRDRQGGCGRPEVSQVPTRSVTARTGLKLRWSPRMTVPHMLPAAVRNASAPTVRVFRSSIQSSSSRCVRFAVADDPATLATGPPYPFHRLQLRLAHTNRL